MIYGNTTYATLTGGTTQNAYEVRLGYQVLSEDVPNNSRQVKLQLEVRSVKSNYYTYGFNQTTTIDGTALSSAGFDMRNINVWQIFGSRTITINGAYNGTKTGSFVTDATTAYGQYTLKSGSASVYISLATLHRPPVISSVNVSERNSNLSGVSGTTFVAYLSNKRFTISYSTYDSATITSFKVYQNNSLIGSSTSNTVDVNYANVDMYYTGSSGNYKTPIYVKITDSMGATTTSNVTNYSVVPYINPSVVTTSSNVKRNGQTTGKVKLNLVANVYRGTIGSTTNGLTLSFAYWIKGNSESSTYYTIPSSAYSISGNTVTINNWSMTKNGSEITDVNKSYNYYFKIKIQDSYKTSYGTLICSKGEWVMAKFKDRVDFKNLTINNGNIIDSGSNYIKFYNGTAICSMSYDVTLANSWSTWGGLYSSSYIELPNYPINFIAEPTTNVTFQRIQGSYNGWLIPHEYANSSISNPGAYQFVRPTNPNASFPIRICIIAVGKWK